MSRSIHRSALPALRATVAAAVIPIAAACGTAARADDTAAGGGEAPVAVRVAPAARSLRRAEVRASGVLEPRATADVAFQVGGRVARVAVEEGDAVRAGDLLAALDPTDYALGLRQAELAAQRADDERRRARPLLDAGSIAPNDFERLDNGARQAAVARDLAAKRLRDATLVAPFDGVVAARRTETGATAAPGTPVFTLVALDEMRVRVGVPEAEVGALRDGMAARVELPALDRVVDGRVRHVGVAADPASRTFAVLVVVPNANGALRGGMVASVVVATGAVRDVVAVPSTAIAHDAEGATRVYVADAASGRVRARRVAIGAPLADGLVEIGDGLVAGEPVVVAGEERLHDGARVTLVADTSRTTVAVTGRSRP
jgi:RND family efflux transporter MFP subunit